MEKKTDLRVEKTYLALQTAFTALLEEKRFEAITVNELCERAMIRRATFYKHFADKYEYFTFYMKEICQSFQNQLPPDIPMDDHDAYFLYMCRELLRFIENHEKLVMNVEDSSLFPTLLDNLSEIIMNDSLDILRRMESTKNLSASHLEYIAAFYSGGLLNALRLWLKRGRKIDEAQFIETVSCFLNTQKS